jgi:Bacteriophage tail sheath protein
MPATVSYPGVYVQEVPSDVRTIVGVGTSIGMFIGRTKTGQMFVPKRLLSYDDFSREFTTDTSLSDMARAVKLFFTNGGTQCYAVRIAGPGFASAAVTMLTEGGAPAPALTATAKSAGVAGEDIRLSVNYNTAQPESTFNLQVFRWTKLSNGTLQKTDVEDYLGLSMDRNHPRYAVDIVSPVSKLITLTDPNAAVALAGTSTSLSGYALSLGTGANSVANGTLLSTQLAALLALGTQFRIGVAGNAPVTVDLTGLPASAGATLNTYRTTVTGFIANAINTALAAGATVAVNFVDGPTGQAGQSNANTQLLSISSNVGDVLIESTGSSDLAGPLMLGTANGGIEISRAAARRPAPNGLVMNFSNLLAAGSDLIAFMGMPQNTFNALTIGTSEVALSGSSTLATTGVAVVSPRMYQDASAATQDDGRRGLREKLGIIAAAIVARRAADPLFPWSAEVWGSRLAIVPLDGPDNLQAPIGTGIRVAPPPAALTPPGTPNPLGAPQLNVRLYQLGTKGAGLFQNTGANPGVAGNPGGVPTTTDYDTAYKAIDREVDLYNLMVLPKDIGHSEADTMKLWGPASVACQARRAFLLIDPPEVTWQSAADAVDLTKGVNKLRVGLVKDYSAVFFPRLRIDEGGKEIIVAPSGAIAGLMGRIDSTRGVWKAPAGTEADIRGIIGVERRFSDAENGIMNQKAVNTIRAFPSGIVNWGARTMDGDDSIGSQYKYIPIRRLALFIEESLYRGLQWAVFEPNDEPLWAQIRLNVGAFMNNLFRQGAFEGASAKEAYFVKCDKDTTTENDRNLGLVNIIVGFAPLKPAEFVVLYLQQIAGQIQV